MECDCSTLVREKRSEASVPKYMPNKEQKPELETHLRLHWAQRKPWLRAIELVSGIKVSASWQRQPVGPAGSVSALVTTTGAAIALNAKQDVAFTQCSAANAFLLFPTGRGVSVASSDGEWQPVDMPFQVGARSLFSLRFAKNSQVIILSPVRMTSFVGPFIKPLPQPSLTGLIKRYLGDIRFYVDEAHATALTKELFEQFAHLQAGCLLPPVQESLAMDRRLVRAIEKIEQNPDWLFNLQELAIHSSASERNLYYLMKHHTGMTPYRFYQRNRLIRVRRRLVDCRGNEPHISRYAVDEGFSHLGRFAALYREHFGELPSETVSWRQRILDADGGAENLTRQEFAFS